MNSAQPELEVVSGAPVDLTGGGEPDVVYDGQVVLEDAEVDPSTGLVMGLVVGEWVD